MKKFNNKYQKPCVPWWDQNCTKLVRQRNKARNRASHTGRGEDFKNYKEKEKLCKKLLHDTQQTYWENYCNSLNNSSNLSRVWYNVKKNVGSCMQILTIVHLAKTYNMFKHLSEKTLSIFLLFINKIWFLQEVPKDWKHYYNPNPQNW